MQPDIMHDPGTQLGGPRKTYFSPYAMNGG